MRGWSKRPDATRIAWGMVGWLAWRRFRSARGEMIVRGMVGVFTVMLLLGASALAPSSLNVAEREANAYPMWVPDESQDRGIRYDVRRGYMEERDVHVLRVARVGIDGAASYGGVEVPGEGEMLVSPAAAALLGESEVFAERYPGEIVGGIPLEFVPGPRSLMIWVGVAESELPPDSLWLAEEWGHDDLRSSVPDVIQVGYVVVIIGFVVPLLALSSIVASLGFRRREERALALTLVGLSRKDIALSGAIEDLILMTAATVGGVALFWAVVPPLAPHLPFGSGVWSSDIAVHVPGTIVLCVLALVLSATLTWVRLSRVGIVRRRRRRAVDYSRLGWLMLAAAVILLALSHVGRVPTNIASYLLLASMPLGMLGLVWGLPGIVRAASGVISHVGVAGTWAGRVVEKEAAAVSRTSMGIVMLLVAAGVMLVFFPLMSATNAVAQKAMSELIGPDTLVGSGEDTKAHRGAWASIRPTDRPSLAIRWHQSGGEHSEMLNTFVVNCTDLAEFTGIPEPRCEGGLLESAEVASFYGPGEEFQLTDDSPVLVVPDTAVVDQAAADLVGEYARGRGLIVSETSVPDLPATGMLYLVKTDHTSIEPVRTRMEIDLDARALTPDEMYRISTYSTRQFLDLLRFSLGLMLAVAGLSTFLTAHDRLKATRPERRLLSISGAGPSTWRRSLLLQAMTPVLVGVVSATTFSLVLAWSYITLFERDGGIAYLPATEMTTLALMTLGISYLAVELSSRLESREELLRAPE
ncbi:hypothetical protein [Tessaracoccus caeni]|uniref:hypothetical protein n=1 Tax=Tessaracoccus caeni TaxID=3031239 RepID=UPI0023D9C7BF|nr:hypothetical protein [Tessaracoccus caeni]MDF1487631.1 hypothetical protein [Tessaracoccus caeni]